MSNALEVEVLLNTYPPYSPPSQLRLVAESIWLFSIHWADLLLFLSIGAVLRHRETIIHATTGEKGACRGNRVLTVAYSALSIIIFVLGTAGPAVNLDTKRRYTAFEHDANTSAEKAELKVWLDQRWGINATIDDMFGSFVVLSAVGVVISTILLWRAGCAAGIRDKVFTTLRTVIQ